MTAQVLWKANPSNFVPVAASLKYLWGFALLIGQNKTTSLWDIEYYDEV